ncbi:hypothetical protein BJF90_04625 [Pseudonocardia sp. CNS-004]|nr:hypothetical protein BJF90_04625 [Pseudonocardia sp. CNS-004]
MLELPPGGPSEEEVVSAAAARGVRIAGLRSGWHDSHAQPGDIMVGYATPADHAWSGALDALIDALRSVLGTTRSPSRQIEQVFYDPRGHHTRRGSTPQR